MIHVDLLLPDMDSKHPVVVSWNRYWSSKHWGARKRFADRMHDQIVVAMNVKYGPRGERKPIENPVFIGVAVYARHKNKLLDADNVCTKPVIDGLIMANVLVDDGPDYVHGLFVVPIHIPKLVWPRALRLIVAATPDAFSRLYELGDGWLREQ